jgi:hypothetical protein
MKVTFISHASILVESNGIGILSDPWWNAPCFGAQWWLYPKPCLAALENRKIDYIYISHGHHDHFHPPTLKTFSRAIKILVRKNSGLSNSLRKLGFDVVEISEDSEYHLQNGVKCRILRTCGDDTLMAISDGRETCLNINDALHSSPIFVRDKFTKLIKKLYGRVDYVFCGYGTASHFPSCYIIPGKDRERTAARRQSYFNLAWAKIVHDLAPKFAFPFAADVVFLEHELFWCNEIIHNSERPTDVFKRQYPNDSTITVDIGPGFSIEQNIILSNKVRGLVCNSTLKELYHDHIRRVNKDCFVDSQSVKEIMCLLEENIEKGYPYLETFKGNYKCLIKLKNALESIQIIKIGHKIEIKNLLASSPKKHDYDLIYTTRIPYLRRSLTTHYGWELLFVGSGGIFEYINRVDIASNIHLELTTILRKMQRCPEPRRAESENIFPKTKRFIKKLISHTEEDLYDLQKWTVFSTMSLQ